MQDTSHRYAMKWQLISTSDAKSDHGPVLKPMTTHTENELTELRTNANELRGMGHSVQRIAQALKISQAAALQLLEDEVRR